MPQVKKEEIRSSITDSAQALFSEFGYHKTTISAISSRAGLSVGNIYAYFPSKLDLLQECFEPWLRSWHIGLEREVRHARTRRNRLIRLLRGIWRDFPARNPGLANSLMEALAAREGDCAKANALLGRIEEELTRLLRQILVEGDPMWWQDNALARLLLMARDGMILNCRWEDPRQVEKMAEMVADLLLHGSDSRGGDGRPQGPASHASGPV